MSETQELNPITNADRLAIVIENTGGHEWVTVKHQDLVSWVNEITRLRALLKDAVAALEDAEDALEHYSDLNDDADGIPQANKAMRALLEVEETIPKLKRALPPPPAQEGE